MILDYKPGNAFYIVGGLVLFVGMVLFAQYKMNGSIDLRALVDTPADPFWARTPELEKVDSFPHTSLAMVRERKSGASGMLDVAVVNSSQVKVQPCGAVPLAYPGGTNTLCLAIVHPDNGSGDGWTGSASFSARAKESAVVEFYRELFDSRGFNVTEIQNSSRGVILEAEDARRSTVARVAIRGSFDTVHGFIAWTPGLEAMTAFEHFLAVRVVDRHEDGVTCECAIRTELLNSQGVLHGGVIASIADEAAWFAIDTHTDRAKSSTTTELKVNYLLPLSGDRVTARAVLLRLGKLLAVTRVDLSGTDRRLAAVAIVTYMFVPGREGA